MDPCDLNRYRRLWSCLRFVYPERSSPGSSPRLKEGGVEADSRYPIQICSKWRRLHVGRLGELLGRWDLMADKETRDGVEEENVVSGSPRGQQKTGDVRRRR